MEYKFDTFIEELKNIGVELTERQLEQFRIYYEMLVEKNKVMQYNKYNLKRRLVLCILPTQPQSAGRYAVPSQF